MKKIALIFGGVSSEYEISLKSAAGVLKTLTDLGHQVYKIGITAAGDWLLTEGNADDLQQDTWQDASLCQEVLPNFNGQGFWLKASKTYLKPDVLLPILHGGSGENGSIQGLFQLMELPYAGCGVASSAICMNKFLLHQFAETIGIQSAPTILLHSISNLQRVEKFIKEQGFPIFVKPNEAGSSKGITKVTESQQLSVALREAFEYSSQVILQKAIVGTEIGCGLLGNHELVVGACDEISLTGHFFDYLEKYQLITAEIKVPAKISAAASAEIQNKAEKLYRLLGCRGLARIDFFLTENGEILLNEVNTLPGFTPHSRYPAMLAAVGVSYSQILEKLISLAEESYYEKYLLTIS